MTDLKIQKVFLNGWNAYSSRYSPDKHQRKAAYAIMQCKTGELGYNLSTCSSCGHIEMHARSCRNRNCPNCQAIMKEVWIDQRKGEVINAPYFHLVFTLPEELNPIVYANQREMYSLIHRCASQTVLKLADDKRYLGATPGIIQVLHTWGQKLNYHPHIHSIVSGGGLTKDGHIRLTRKNYFAPALVLMKVYRGKVMDSLNALLRSGSLVIPPSCGKNWTGSALADTINSLYEKDWDVIIKETFNGFGNAIEYLGRYTHRIAISNARIISVSEDQVSFLYKDYKEGGRRKVLTLSNDEFVRRFMMHVLPPGFQKIRYYGFLNNARRQKNLQLIARIQNGLQYRSKFSRKTPIDVLLMSTWGVDIHKCPCCGKATMVYLGHSMSLQFD